MLIRLIKIIILALIIILIFFIKTTRTTTQDYIKKGINYFKNVIKYQQFTGFGKHDMQELRDDKESQGRSYPNANENSDSLFIKKFFPEFLLKFFSNPLGSSDKKLLANDKNLTNLSRNRNSACN
jgi:hypothetical protein